MRNKFFVGDINFGVNPQECFRREGIWNDSISMNDDLILNWNDTITDDDSVFILGNFFDSTFYSDRQEEQKEIYESLRGNKFYIQNTKLPHNKYNHELGPVLTELTFIEKSYLIRVTNNFDMINRIGCNFSVVSSTEFYIQKYNPDFIYYEDQKTGAIILQNNLPSPVYNVCIDSWDFMPVSIDELLSFYSHYKK